LVFFGISSFAQAKALKLTTNTIDFGRIASIAYPAKVIEFANAVNEKLAILLIEKGPNVEVNFERRFYQPGEKGQISVYYDVRELGEINEEIKIFTNIDSEPETVTLKGTCISVQECFPNSNNLNLRNILVVDKNTQKPVPLATITFRRNHNTRNPVELKMDKNGKATEELPIGLYNINGTVNGYEPYANETFIPKTLPSLLIELTPKQIISVVQPPAHIPEIGEVADASIQQQVTITSAELPEDQYAANNIILLLDVSSSMQSQGKFNLLQQSVNNLIMILRQIDYVTIITYASASKLVLPAISVSEKEKITGIVQDLVPNGSTQGVKGLNTAYDMATSQYITAGNNQIILATDGEFSEKGVKDNFYEKLISDYTQKGIKLSIFGFGVNEQAIVRMKKMAASGNGNLFFDSFFRSYTALL
jgi:Mg-chelatase subunit ChlD